MSDFFIDAFKFMEDLIRQTRDWLEMTGIISNKRSRYLKKIGTRAIETGAIGSFVASSIPFDQKASVLVGRANRGQTTQLQSTVNVTVPEGSDAAGIAARVKDTVTQVWDVKMREAAAALGQ
jgi:hypothetical protein